MNFIEGGQLDEVVRHEPMPIWGAVELIAKVAALCITRTNTAFYIETLSRGTFCLIQTVNLISLISG
jgi:hypothetical protein